MPPDNDDVVLVRVLRARVVRLLPEQLRIVAGSVVVVTGRVAVAASLLLSQRRSGVENRTGVMFWFGMSTLGCEIVK